MLIVFSCGNCGRKFEKDESLAGKKARCKDCGHVFVIPTPSRRPAPVAAPTRMAAAVDAGRPGPSPNHSATPQFTKVVEDPYGFNDVPIAKPEPEPEFATSATSR